MGARVSFSGDKPKVSDGPFAGAKEVLGGYWMIQVKSKEEAIEWAKRCPGSDNEVIETSGPGDVGLPSRRHGSRGRIRRPSSAVQENEVNSTLRGLTSSVQTIGRRCKFR